MIEFPYLHVLLEGFIEASQSKTLNQFTKEILF